MLKPLLALMLVDMLAVICPGPSFLTVLQRSVARGCRAGFAVAAGLMVADWLWCTVALGGLFAIFRIVPWLYGALKIAGGGYLVWLGIQFWRQQHAAIPCPAATGPETMPETAAPRDGSFVKGILVGMTNPKAAIYYSCIFAQFVHPTSPLWFQAAAVGIITLDGLLWYGFVAAAFSRARIRTLYDRCRTGVERTAGSVMAIFGAKLILED